VATELTQLLAEQLGIDRALLEHAEQTARERDVTLVEALVDDQVVAEDSLADVVARAAGSVVVDLDEGALEGEATVLLSRTVAWTHLALPVSADSSQRGLRVAFANPLDREALAAVEASTGCAVTPLVATVSALRAAIERTYHHLRRDTEIVHERRRDSLPEIPREDTRRMAPDLHAPMVYEAMRTTPMARLEDQATPEQLVEALVLTLIEAGVITRADYIRVLGRLLGRRDA
jgi:hypothetical protein